MMYIFYIIITIIGLSRIIDGVRCFTKTGTDKLIKKQKAMLALHEKASDRTYVLKGVVMTSVGILFIYFSFIYFMGK